MFDLDLNVTDFFFLLMLKLCQMRRVLSACINSFVIKAYRQLPFVSISSVPAVFM